PSEAHSLLLRVTRNCAWHRWTFCPGYKDSRFSLRPVEHVIQDIDTVYETVSLLLADDQNTNLKGFAELTRDRIAEVAGKIGNGDFQAFQAAVQWVMNGMSSIFLQDADSLTIKPADTIKILQHLRKRFPGVERITTYARSHTIARIKEEQLQAMADAGLNRIHIGLESGCDTVLERVCKGVTKETHITAGLKVKSAGMELSEYVMPGLGGKGLSREHALETADVLNRIDPHFIRLRTLAIPNRLELYEEFHRGEFEKCSDLEVAEEILLFIKTLDGISSTLKSDHILNLFLEVEGKLPRDKARMMAILESFLAMEPQEQCIYQVGKRLGVFIGLSDLEDGNKRTKVEKICLNNGITPDNVDAVIDEQTKRFI
ncbi:MAG: radical SAM protein, partial [bacterium]|nr:radical SAM protein [bacterium]